MIMEKQVSRFKNKKVTMNFTPTILTLCSLVTSCETIPNSKPFNSIANHHAAKVSEKTVSDIRPPDGFKQLAGPALSFDAFLQKQKLKSDKTVYLFDGQKKANQSAQYAVLDISVGEKDLQQCADAVMRLRAEYFYEQGKFERIEFYNGKREKLNYTKRLNGKQNSRENFMKYMDYVFSYCGTASLPYSLKNKAIKDLQIGDILLKPGSPGHTVMVMNLAENVKGQKVYLLAQSYMPAQDIHILKNPMNSNLSPWYELNDDEVIDTPEWKFYKGQLYGWK